ncbi:MAG: GTP-binding protein [Algibacter sp.]|uniref:GTP-binding protein n=1 Tax=Algibacter sp. TaxID=1872428 RepID=UPI002618F593|nr:GTP-binding protein [Algibacter sp.]MDG1730692.1 GTP-binding protein [Algibacter sp.]MDG2177643.1 GTP-binding protein [Algibacter sp.]
MPLSNDIVLRPRFKMDIPRHNEAVLSDFENTKTTQSEFIVTRVDDHVFIKFPKEKQHFWSPQLHLEINKIDENSSKLHGLFGPSPTVWTLFMFLHFMVAGVFIAFAIWTYTNISLKQSYVIQASVTLLMVLIWITLYFAGSIGKASSTKDMRLLNNFMNRILSIENEKAP